MYMAYGHLEGKPTLSYILKGLGPLYGHVSFWNLKQLQCSISFREAASSQQHLLTSSTLLPGSPHFFHCIAYQLVQLHIKVESKSQVLFQSYNNPSQSFLPFGKAFSLQKSLRRDVAAFRYFASWHAIKKEKKQVNSLQECRIYMYICISLDSKQIDRYCSINVCIYFILQSMSIWGIWAWYVL